VKANRKDAGVNKADLTDSLRQMIGSLPPGAPLPGQRTLCATHGVTTWLLNESLRNLEQEGLVEIRPRKGVFVRSTSAEPRHILRAIYLDRPGFGRYREFGVEALTAAASRHGAECRATHVPYEDWQGLGRLLESCRRDPRCVGAVLSGHVSPGVARLLEGVGQPWVLLGDGHSRVRLNRLPIVITDAFQGARLGTDLLLAEGCTALVLVNFFSEPAWPWVTEGRAGAFSALERHPDASVFLPQIDCVAEPRKFEQAAEQWLAEKGDERVGILCRGSHVFHVATSIRHMLSDRMEPLTVVQEYNLSLVRVPGVRYVFCSLMDVAEACLRRLDARRRGLDTPGPLLIPYALVDDAAGEREGENTEAAAFSGGL